MKLLDRLAWIDRLPVPQRNGAKGAVLMVSLLWILIGPVPGAGNGGPLDVVVCGVMPWRCSNSQSDGGTCKRYPHARFVSNIHIGKSSGKQQDCTCHYDVRDSGVVWHLIGAESETCESGREREKQEPHYLSEQWILFTGAGHMMFMNGREIRTWDSGEWRFHCTAEARYSVPGIIEEADSAKRNNLEAR